MSLVRLSADRASTYSRSRQVTERTEEVGVDETPEEEAEGIVGEEDEPITESGHTEE